MRSSGTAPQPYAFSSMDKSNIPDILAQFYPDYALCITKAATVYRAHLFLRQSLSPIVDYINNTCHKGMIDQDALGLAMPQQQGYAIHPASRQSQHHTPFEDISRDKGNSHSKHHAYYNIGNIS